MFAANTHLDEEALVKRYLADRGLEVLSSADEPLLKHLAHCEACSTRYAGLASTLDASRADAVAEADAAFTTDRLVRQQDRILRRLEAQSGPRVISFPAAHASRPAASQAPMYRWVAAAAVAGLMVGVTAGRYLDFGELMGHFGKAASVASAPSGSQRATPSLRPGAANTSVVDDDELLTKVNEALTTDEQTSELAAIYALTIRGNDMSRAMRVKY